jgi:hypothetical protein
MPCGVNPPGATSTSARTAAGIGMQQEKRRAVTRRGEVDRPHGQRHQRHVGFNVGYNGFGVSGSLTPRGRWQRTAGPSRASGWGENGPAAHENASRSTSVRGKPVPTEAGTAPNGWPR